MKKLQKIRDEYADQIGCKHFEDYGSTFVIDVDDVELLMKRAYNQALEDVKEIQEHNESILKTIEHNPEDFISLMDEGCTDITGKIEWVDKPNFKPEQNPDKYGVFTLTYVDQWSVGMEGDSFEGFMYVKVKGKDKYLKIPYSC